MVDQAKGIPATQTDCSLLMITSTGLSGWSGKGCYNKDTDRQLFIITATGFSQWLIGQRVYQQHGQTALYYWWLHRQDWVVDRAAGIKTTTRTLRLLITAIALNWPGKGYNSYTDTHCGAVYTDYTASIIRAKHGGGGGGGGSPLTARRIQTSWVFTPTRGL